MKNRIVCGLFCGLILCLVDLTAQTVEDQIDFQTDTLLNRRVSLSSSDAPPLGPLDNKYRPLLIPPSPNASALAKYAECPVSYYTGTPDINIPLYEINAGDFTLPITLNYHASGIKVAQEASSVGLGWSLNAGGCIVREMRGYDDFYEQTNHTGYYYNKYPTSEPEGTAQGLLLDLCMVIMSPCAPGYELQGKKYNTYNLYTNGVYDMEPDVFHYNFAGHNGTLFFNPDPQMRQVPARPVVQQIEEYLDFTYDIKTDKWEATDGQGTRFFFGDREFTTIYNLSHDGSSDKGNLLEYLDKGMYGADNAQPTVATAWFLDSIITSTQQKIQFNYQKEDIKTVPTLSEHVNTILGVGLTDNSIPGPCRSSTYTFSYARTQQLFLSSISYNNMTISLGSAPRYDIKSYLPGIPAKRTSNLEIRSDGSLINTIHFFHSYLGSSGGIDIYNHRLLLDSIQFAGSPMGAARGTIRFGYNRGALPPKYSADTDFWGYYTHIKSGINASYWGKEKAEVPTEQTSIPPMITKYNNEPLIIYGKDRSPDAESMQHGILQSIGYPTGGSTQFKYEPHEYLNSFTASAEEKVPVRESFQPNGVLKAGSTFSVNKTTVIEFTSTLYLGSNALYDRNKVLACECYIRKVGENTSVARHTFFGQDEENRNETVINRKRKFYLGAGEYQVFYKNDLNNSYTISTVVKQYDPKEHSTGGGLRIREIYEEDNGMKANHKKYNYRYQGRSSGALLITPVFTYTNTLYYKKKQCPEFQGPIFESAETQPWESPARYHPNLCITGTSDPYVKPIGVTVGYSYVEEIYEGNSISGKVAYSFENMPTGPGASIIHGMYQNFDPDNGLLMNMTMFDKDGYKVLSKEYQYNRLANYYASRWIQNPALNPFKIYPITASSYGFWVQYYLLPYGHIRKPTVEYQTEYFNNGQDSLTTKKTIEYNSVNLLPTLIKTWTSAGDTLTEQKKYVTDYTSNLMLQMCNRHLVNLPVEELTLRNGKVIKGMKTQYGDTLGMFLPKSIYSLNPATPQNLSDYSSLYRKEVSFDLYNKDGRPLQISDNGQTFSYLWSYNGMYPVAEVRNATYAEVEARFGGRNAVDAFYRKSALTDQDTESLIQLRLQFPEALVNAYTYYPLRGIRSHLSTNGVKTMFEYDDTGRLQLIRNTENEILKFYKYHYR